MDVFLRVYPCIVALNVNVMRFSTCIASHIKRPNNLIVFSVFSMTLENRRAYTIKEKSLIVDYALQHTQIQARFLSC